MKDIDKNKMKHTIGYKMTVIIVAIMGLSLIAASIFSSFFLSKYYKKTKQDSIKKVYNELIKITQDDSDIENSDDVSILNNICEKAGATMIVVDSAGESIYDYGAGKMLADRWKDMIFGSNTKQKEEPKIIEKNDKYTIQSTVDRFSANQYYELSGGVSSGNYVVIRMSVESFRESIAIANKFYLGVGISLILVTTIIIIGITRKYTQPLLQLADISKRMSELDFNVKYADERNDEIGVLGESMNEMSDKLETAISELKSANLQLHKDIAKKEEVDEMRKEFISNVSHELKTPIALIQGYAEGLQESISDNPEDMDYYCDVIIDEAKKMNRMVLSMISLNQIETGNNEMEYDHFDIVALLEGMIQSMKILLQQNDISLSFAHDQEIFVYADEYSVEQVVSNYLSNAIHYAKNEKKIDIKLTKKEHVLRVSVFNTGDPIPQDSMEHIWDKFYKVDKARTREYGGTGIGLSIVKAIMESMGQEYGVQNHENGVEFWFEVEC